MSFENICFVISPIGAAGSEIRKHADDVLEFIIKPALADYSLKAIRSDEISEPGTITDQMFEYILKSKFCIVLLTNENANVFYELAVAQCAGIPTLLLLEENKNLPFDIKDMRVAHYNLNDPRRLMSKSDVKNIQRHIDSIKENNWQSLSLLNKYSHGIKVLSEIEIARKAEFLRPTPLNYTNDKVFFLNKELNSQLKIITGSVEHVSNIDIIVNSENVDLQLARFYDLSLSGILRYLDADKSAGGNVIRDHLNEQIQNEIIKIGSVPVKPGTVVATKTSGLEQQGVKYIFHLALARGEIGSGYQTVTERLEAGIRNVFKEFTAKHKMDNSISSILFPLIGAGTAKINPNEAGMNMVQIIVDEIRKLPISITVYLLARLDSHRIAFREAALKLNLIEAE
jgi:O-acetyl-ADP-ribose deacetylase (regulator of RNase III)